MPPTVASSLAFVLRQQRHHPPSANALHNYRQQLSSSVGLQPPGLLSQQDQQQQQQQQQQFSTATPGAINAVNNGVVSLHMSNNNQQPPGGFKKPMPSYFQTASNFVAQSSVFGDHLIDFDLLGPPPPLPVQKQQQQQQQQQNHLITPPITPPSTSNGYFERSSSAGVVMPLLSAIQSKNDFDIWAEYKKLSHQGLGCMTRHDFSQLLLSLHPAHGPSYWDASSSAAVAAAATSSSGGSRTSPPRSFGKVIEKIEEIENTMRSLGFQLTGMEYTHLLECYRYGKDQDKCHKTWARLNEEGVEKDTRLWNTYLRVLTKQAQSSPFLREMATQEGPLNLFEEDFRFITAPATSPKGRNNSNNSNRFSAGVNGGNGGERHVVERAQRLVEEMIASGVRPNNGTYELLLSIYGRVGDIDKIVDTCYHVWGLDITQRRQDDVLPDDAPLAKGQLLTSPTTTTVEAVVNALGYNDQMSMAVSYVWRFNQNYKYLQLSQEVDVWESVLRWSYVSAKDNGGVPRAAMMRLWKMICQEVHVVPSLEMYMLILKSERLLGHCDNMELLAREIHSRSDLESRHEAAYWAVRNCVLKLVRLGAIDKARLIANFWSTHQGNEYRDMSSVLEKYIVDGDWIVRREKRMQRLRDKCGGASLDAGVSK